MDTTEIAQKRAEFQQKQSVQNTHQESLDAVTDSGREVVQATGKLAKTADIDKLIEQVKEVQLASMLSNNKPNVILTDQTDLGEKIGELTTKLVDAVKTLDSNEVDGKQVNELVRAVSRLDALNGLIANNFKYADKQRKDMISAIKALKLSHVVNVPAPKVTVEAPKLDLSPITNAIERIYKQPEENNTVYLDCYRAQDINNSNPKLQYIGFMNSEGNWYIVENDIAKNTLRYVFGTDNYESAFERAASYSYSLLNEAVHALST